MRILATVINCSDFETLCAIPAKKHYQPQHGHSRKLLSHRGAACVCEVHRCKTHMPQTRRDRRRHCHPCQCFPSARTFPPSSAASRALPIRCEAPRARYYPSDRSRDNQTTAQRRHLIFHSLHASAPGVSIVHSKPRQRLLMLARPK